MSKMFFRCAPDNEKLVFGGVPFRAKREMLRKRCECVCESEREGTGEGEGMFLRAVPIFCFFFFFCAGSGARARGCESSFSSQIVIKVKLYEFHVIKELLLLQTLILNLLQK